MSTQSVKIHPLVAAASAAVILVSLLGAAALLDWLPGSGSHDAPAGSSVTAPTQNASAMPAQAAAAPSPSAPHSTPKAAQQAAQQAPQPGSQPPAQRMSAAPAAVPPLAQSAPVCAVCGKVVSVRSVEAEAPPSGVGVVAGAVVGGLLGNQVGGGSGRTLATVAGAVGGGYAGNEIEKRTRKAVAYEVDVQLETRERQTFRFDTQPPWKAGDRVRVADGTLVSR